MSGDLCVIQLPEQIIQPPPSKVLQQQPQTPHAPVQPVSIQVIDAPSTTHPALTKSCPSTAEQQQPSPPPQRRSRVGLSKRNATVLHDISPTESPPPATSASPKRHLTETGSGSISSISGTPSAPRTSAFVSGSAIEALGQQQAQDTR